MQTTSTPLSIAQKRQDVALRPAMLVGQNGEHHFYFDFCKRIFDIFFSLIFLATIGWWLFPLMALLIKIDSKGPVFFVQARTGLYNNVFHCIKFRTMCSNEEADMKQALTHDTRITRLGHFLRQSNLDELSQVFNVLKGEMSLVGPRPHMVYHTLLFGGMLPHYEDRHQVKPGITGLSQILGYRGPTPTRRSIYKRVQWDMFYAHHRSVKLDAYILWRTFLHVIENTLFVIRKG